MKKLMTILMSMVCLCAISQTLPYSDRIYGGSNGGIVGTIEDELQVTPTGQLSYSIPIPTVSGTGGVKPALSIVYTGSASNGLFGYGFDLGGLSVINRAPSDRFRDNKVTTIDFTSDDRFNLDGVRLVKVWNSDSSITEYKTEKEYYSYITSSGDPVNPDSFTVKTKSGLTYTYKPVGELTGGSKEKTLFWAVSRVEDTMGNYYACEYEGEPEFNDFRIKKISYTGNGNTGLSPYASVQFTYTVNTTAAPVSYVHGVPVRHSGRVTSVRLYDGTTCIKRFQASYILKGSKYLLSEVREYGRDGKWKNPTKFGWTSIDDFHITQKDYSTTPLITKALLNVGDFNGDGKGDFIATPESPSAGWSGWKIFISDGGSVGLASSGTFRYPERELKEVACGDFNGDGLTDIVAVQYLSSIKSYVLELYLTRIRNGQPMLDYVNLDSSRFSKKEEFNAYPIEFTGDGVTDICILYKDSARGQVFYSQNLGTSGVGTFYLSSSFTCSDKWGRVEFGDFNGDGLTDIINLNTNGHRILYKENGKSGFSEKSGTFPESRHHLEVGDFNADGKSDLILSGWDPNPQGDWAEWCIMYSKGDLTFERSYVPSPMDARTSKLFVTDIDGDGHDDFIAVPKTSPGSSMTKARAFVFDGAGKFTEQGSGSNIYGLDKWRFHVADVNGDAKPDLIVTANWTTSTWNGCQLFIMPEDPNRVLSSITDGLGNKTEVSYGYMTDTDLCKRIGSFKYPLVSCQAPWPLVKSLAVPDGIGGTRVTEYRYSNPVSHSAGRGFLGFERFESMDTLSRSRTVTEFEIEPDVYAVGVKRTRCYVNDILVSESETTNALVKTLMSNIGTPKSFSYLPVATVQTSYEPNSGETVSESETETEYDVYGNQVKVVTRTGGITSTTENTYINDSPRWIIGRLTASKVTREAGGKTSKRNSEFTYDSNGLLSKEVFQPKDNTLGHTTTYTRDSYGNVISSTVRINGSSSGRTTTTTYDSKGRYLLTTTDPLGFKVTNTVDQGLGVVTQTEDLNGLKTCFSHDGFGNPYRTVTPVSTVTEITGWSSGMADAPAGAVFFRYIESEGSPSSMTFLDGLGRKLRTVVEGYGGKRIYTDYAYNAKGELEKSSEPYFKGDEVLWNINEYDIYGRSVSQKTAAGDITSFGYDGLTTTVTDPLGHTSAKTVNILGQLVSSEDSMGNSVEFEYDVDGNCVTVHSPRTTITMQYDILGNRTVVNDPDAGTVTDTYNGFGELTRHQDTYGIVHYEYDAGGRLLSADRPEGKVSYKYDKGWKGELDAVSLVSEDEMTGRTFSYDRLGRLVKETQDIDGQQYTMRYSYNANSRIDSLIYPGGLTVRHEYDSRGVLLSVKNAGSGHKYWSLGEVNARGQVTRETYGNNLTTNTTYHRYRGSIDRIQTSGIQNWEYEFDAIGNLLSRRDCIRGVKEDFGYDALNRLTEVGKAGTVRQTIEYDGAGNITYKSDVGRYQYKEGSNRLTMIKDCKADPLSWNDIKYNSWGKVTYVAIRGNVLHLAYGPSGERIHQSYADHECSYVGRYYEFVKNAKTGVSKDVNYIFNGEHLVAIVEKEQGSGNETVMYVHHDHLGSIQVLTGSLKQVLQEFSYDAWGNRRNPLTWEVYKRQDDAMALNPHGFGGHEHLDVFEMINMGGRVYDPVVGRFISADPFVQSPDIAQCFNRYAYCANNPLSLVDPSGYSWFSRNWKALTAAVVGIVVSGVTMGIGSGIAAVIISGAAGGAAASLTGALLNGANIMQVAKTTLVGAVIGGASGFLNFASADSNLLLSLMKHSFSHGWIEAVQGGNFVHGLYMGAIAKGGGYLIDTYVSGAGKIVEIAANAALSGTLDELGGGKFANGAVTGAFAMMFNELKHLTPPEKKEEGMSDGQIWASSLTMALTAAEIDGAAPYGDVVGASILQATALYFIAKFFSESFIEFAKTIESVGTDKIYATYVLRKGNVYYVGRTSGLKNLYCVLRARFYKHQYINLEGFKFHKLDKWALGVEGYYAIRGREQQLLDSYGGVGHSQVANTIRAVRKSNKLGRVYHEASNIMFKEELNIYTGDL